MKATSSKLLRRSCLNTFIKTTLRWPFQVLYERAATQHRETWSIFPWVLETTEKFWGTIPADLQRSISVLLPTAMQSSTIETPQISPDMVLHFKEGIR